MLLFFAIIESFPTCRISFQHLSHFFLSLSTSIHIGDNQSVLVSRHLCNITKLTCSSSFYGCAGLHSLSYGVWLVRSLTGGLQVRSFFVVSCSSTYINLYTHRFPYRSTVLCILVKFIRGFLVFTKYGTRVGISFSWNFNDSWCASHGNGCLCYCCYVDAGSQLSEDQGSIKPSFCFGCFHAYDMFTLPLTIAWNRNNFWFPKRAAWDPVLVEELNVLSALEIGALEGGQITKGGYIMVSYMPNHRMICFWMHLTTWLLMLFWSQTAWVATNGSRWRHYKILGRCIRWIRK